MSVIKFPEKVPEPDDGIQMYCAGCGVERTIPNAASIGPCSCGSTMRVSASLRGKVWDGSASGRPA